MGASGSMLFLDSHCSTDSSTFAGGTAAMASRQISSIRRARSTTSLSGVWPSLRNACDSVSRRPAILCPFSSGVAKAHQP